MKFIKGFLMGICCLFIVGCSSTYKYETKEEYALAFAEAMNNQDVAKLDKLISKEAVIFYDETGKMVKLGKAKDKDSELYRLLAMGTTFEDIEIRSGLNGAVVLTALHNDALNNIYKYESTEYSAYDIVVENEQIVCIYAYYNEEEALNNIAYQEAQIGLEVERVDDHLEITKVVEGTVSSVMKLQAGDYIYAIDGVNVSEMSSEFNEVSLRLMGKIGSKCELEIQRIGKENHETIYLTRQPLTDYADSYDILEDNGIDFEYGEYFEYYVGEE